MPRYQRRHKNLVTRRKTVRTGSACSYQTRCSMMEQNKMESILYKRKETQLGRKRAIKIIRKLTNQKTTKKVGSNPDEICSSSQESFSCFSSAPLIYWRSVL